jgi:hypothetical protein
MQKHTPHQHILSVVDCHRRYTTLCALFAGEEHCSIAYRLPKPGDTVFLSSEHWKLHPGAPCQQARFQLLLTKAVGRGYSSQIYEAQLQQCAPAAHKWSQGFSPDQVTNISSSSNCQHFVDACKLPPTLTEPGRRLALKIRHQHQNMTSRALPGCNPQWMERTRDMFLSTHTVLTGMSSHAHALTSYLVGDIHAAKATTDAQKELGAPAHLLDLAEGQNLWSVVGEAGPIDTHRVISQVLRTLVELNKKGWVHQDLTLGQIVCGRRAPHPLNKNHMDDGSITNCYVVDFDVLQFLGNATDIPHTAVFPLPHLGPDYVRGHVASTTHVWSLGFAMLQLRGKLTKYTAVELLSGRKENAQTLATLRSKPYMHLSQVEWNFVRRCMTYDWKERPTTTMLTEDEYIVKGVLEQVQVLEATEVQGPGVAQFHAP